MKWPLYFTLNPIASGGWQWVLRDADQKVLCVTGQDPNITDSPSRGPIAAYLLDFVRKGRK